MSCTQRAVLRRGHRLRLWHPPEEPTVPGHFRIPSSVTLTRLPPSDSSCVTYISDQTTDVFGLIARSAPERETQLREFQQSYPVPICKVDDRPGIVMNATSQRVEYASKDLEVLWLAGFSLWKAIRLFAPAIVIPSQLGGTQEAIIELDEHLPEFEYDYQQRLAAIPRVIEAPTVDRRLWPPDIPSPVSSRDDLSSTEHKAVYDLVLMATAVLFLHELRHVKFASDERDGIARPIDREEERRCDEHAHDWFIAGHRQYAAKNALDPQRVCSKRAMALLIVCEFLRFAKDHTGTVGADLYPPLPERIAVLAGSPSLPDTDCYWLMRSCVLFAEARRRGLTSLAPPSRSAKTIGDYLQERLAS